MKNKITVLLFIIYIATFSILGIILKDKEISTTERRKLSTYPEYTLSSEYVNKLDKYLLDHFPLRDNFRSIKAKFNYNILHKLDNNNIYLKDNYIFKSEYPTNKDSISNFINKINKFKSSLTDNNNTYIMIIPDKNYYLDSRDFLQIDYNYLYNEISKLNIKEIDIRNIMISEDYYQTDTHWRQEKLDKVIYEMGKIMNFNYQKITLIDNRYINSQNYLNLIEFTNQDILFMYSTLIVNNSGSLKG